MSDKIKRSDLAENNLFEDITKSAREALNQIHLMDETLKSIAATLKQTSNSSDNSASSIAELAAAMQVAKKAAEEKQRIDIAQKKITIDLTALEQKQGEIERQLAKDKKNQIDWNKKVEKGYLSIIGTLKENIKKREEEKTQLGELNELMKKRGSATAEELKRAEQLKQSIAQRNIIIKQQIKNEELAKGSSQQLQTELGLMRRAYRELTKEQQNSDFGRGLFADIQALRAEVESTNESVGNFQHNVGNYAGSMKEALNSTGLLTTGIAPLDAALTKLTEGFGGSKKAADKAADGYKKSGQAASALSKITSMLGKALKFTGLGAVLLLFSSFTATLKQGDEGAKKMNTAMDYMQAIISVVIQALVNLFNYGKKAFAELELGLQKMSLAWSKVFGSNDDVAKTISEINRLEQSVDKINKELSEAKTLSQIWNEEIAKAAESAKLFEDTFKHRRNVIAYNNEISRLTAKFEAAQAIVNDETLSRKEQIEAMKIANKLELQIADNKVAAARAAQQLAASEAAALKLKSMGGGSIEAEEKLAAAALEVNAVIREREEIIRQQTKTNRLLLIEQFDENYKIAVATAKFNRSRLEAAVNDEKKSIERRIELYQSGVNTIKGSITAVLDGFNDLADGLGKNLDLAFKNNQVFLNGTRLAIDNADALKKQLRDLELPASMIDDLVSYFKELTTNQEVINKMNLSVEGLAAAFEHLQSETKVSRAELEGLKQLGDEMERLNTLQFKAGQSDDEIAAIIEQRKTVKNQLEQVNKEVILNAERAQMERIELTIKGLKAETEALEVGSTEREKKEKEIIDNRIALENIKQKQLKRLADEQSRIEADFLKKQADREKQAQKEREERERQALENRKKAMQAAQELTKSLTDYTIQQQDKQIAALNKNLEQQAQLRQSLQAMAQQGNIQAEQSIKSVMEEERKAEKEKIRIEKNKQRLQLISQGLQGYMSALAAGKTPKEALLETTLTTALLMSFLEGLKGFASGTESAPKGLAWTQERGAEIIMDKHGKIKTLGTNTGAALTYLERGDRVYTATESLRIMQGLNPIPQKQAATVMSDTGVIKELRELRDTIANLPTHTAGIDTTLEGIAALVSTERSGNKTTVSKYYIKK
jgi:hypothetical protein